jgi:hypothetical protein
MSTAWRSEAILILRPDAQLPDLCLCCGREAGGQRVRKSFRWHRPLLYLLAVHPLIYLLVMLAVRRRARVSLPLCARHGRLRRIGLASAWSLIPTASVACVWGLLRDSVPLATLGLYVTLAAGVVAALTARLATVVGIDDNFVRLRGAHLALLDLLPDWDAFEEPRP